MVALYTVIKMHIGYNECMVNSGRDERGCGGRKFFIERVTPELNLVDECWRTELGVVVLGLQKCLN